MIAYRKITMCALCLLMMAALCLPLMAAAETEDAGLWYIWGDNMATESEATDYSFEKAFDPEDFRPAITPYLLADQGSAKGNVLVCSGGGDRVRSNGEEGVPTCEYLNSIGYNAFLLDYRVRPYRSGSATLDVQRAVRYLKHYGEELGIANLDKIATMGFSAGAMHCYAQAIAFSDSITPDTVYENYTCDDVDQVSADVTAVVCVYAAGMPHDTLCEDVDISNPILLLEEGDPNTPEQLPAFFFAGASGHFASGFCVTAYQTLNPLTSCELHMYAGINGPFALGTQYDGADQMRDQLEAFLEFQFGYRDREKKE